MSIRNELLEDIHQAILSGGSTPYYVEATRFIDLTTQTGSVIDTFTGVKLGAGGSDPEGLVTATSDGVVTINKSGPYMVKQGFQLSRNSNPGNAEIFFQAQISIDNGVSWSVLGNAINRRIANDNTINVFFDVSPVFLPAGVKVRNVWAKSSVGGEPSNPTSGVDNGILIYTQPSAALLAAGITPVPSAIAVIYKLQGYNYI